MQVSKIGRRGQIAIPSKIRQELDLQEGDRIAFIAKGNEIVIQPLRHNLLDIRGSLPVSQPQDFEAIRTEMIATGIRSHG